MTDNGPDLRSLALDQWAHERGIRLRFLSIEGAKREVEAWRVDYNTNRLHTILDGLTPSEFLSWQSEAKCQDMRGWVKAG